ncbi:MAG: 6-bladed beta-propeller [Porphyromonadaceae bacterium]|nr:MAG: 6-bladed beta-propeller [Porphyromonadaceae bacterium]
MKNKFKFAFISILFPCQLLVSCSDNQNQIKGADNLTFRTYAIDINKVKEAKIVKLSLLVKDIEYIRLETKNDCLLWEAVPKFGSNDIFVQSGGKVYRFDNSGKFLNTIGMLGKGPEEYVKNYGWVIDEQNERIYIRSNENKIVAYNYQGNHYKTFSIPGPACATLVFRAPNRLDISVTVMPSKDGKPSLALLVTDMDGNPVKEYSAPAISKNLGVGGCPILFRAADNDLFMPYFSDTLYAVSDTLLFPKAVFSLGSLKYVPDEEFNFSNENPASYFVAKIMAFPKHYLVFLINRADIKNSPDYLINKETDEMICIKPTLDKFTFENDLNGGPEPKNLTIENDSLLVGYIQAIDLIDWVKRKKHLDNPDIIRKDQREELVRLASMLSENDNPIVVKYILK